MRISRVADLPVLSTARFTLRPLQREDTGALLTTLGDPEQCRFLTRPAFGSESELWDWLADPSWPGQTWIAVDADGAVAGRFVAAPAHADDVFEIGYITLGSHQGQRVASECAGALIDHLFASPGGVSVRKITAEVDTRNTPSMRLLERLGFTREATLREHEETHIGLCDVHWYGLLAREWNGGSASRIA